MRKSTFSTDFKKQVVVLYENGKSRQDIVREYKLTASALDIWILQFKQTGSFEEKDNQSIETQELIALRKRNKQLEMVILKQAALIMVRKEMSVLVIWVYQTL